MKPLRAFLILFVSLLLYGAYIVCLQPDDRALSWIHTAGITTDTIPDKDTLPGITPKIAKPDTTIMKKTTPRQSAINSVLLDLSGCDSSFWVPLHEKLVNSPNKPLHILYFGDSQTEGDRITSRLRQLFQDEYGGEGIGLLPLQHTYNMSHGFNMTISSNWKRHMIFDKKKPVDDYGLLCGFNQVDTDKQSNAWIDIKPISQNRKKHSQFTHVGLFYASSDSTARLSFQLNGDNWFSHRLRDTPDIRLARFAFEESPRDIKLLFSETRSLKIYGLNLSAPHGVYVDNISLRGCIYPRFSSLKATSLKYMLSQLNPGLIILHYGVNLVPNPQKNYNWYKRALVREINLLKSLQPGLPVIIVGISDMAHRQNGQLKSYPNIALIKKAQREAACEAGAAFWDMEKAMGGKNSMVKWVSQSPRLANKDYTHFSHTGADSIGTLLYRAIDKEIKATQLLLNRNDD